MLKYLHAIAAILFLTIAVLQLNDPDPLYWVVVYASVALLAGGRYLGRRLGTLSKVTIGMVVAGILFSTPGFIDYVVSEDFASISGGMVIDKPYIESAREFGGLVIAAFYLTFSEMSVSSNNGS